MSIGAIMPKVYPEYKSHARMSIIDRAIDAFAENGFQGTKMIDIAKKVGISKATLYSYFDSKDELFLAVAERSISNRQVDLFSQIQDENISIISTEKFFDRMISFYSKSTSLSYEIIIAASKNQELSRKLNDAYKKRFESLFSFFLNLQSKGIIRNDVDPRILGLTLTSLRSGLFSSLNSGLLQIDKELAKNTWTYVIGNLLDNFLT